MNEGAIVAGAVMAIVAVLTIVTTGHAARLAYLEREVARLLELMGQEPLNRTGERSEDGDLD